MLLFDHTSYCDGSLWKCKKRLADRKKEVSRFKDEGIVYFWQICSNFNLKGRQLSYSYLLSSDVDQNWHLLWAFTYQSENKIIIRDFGDQFPFSVIIIFLSTLWKESQCKRKKENKATKNQWRRGESVRKKENVICA